MLRAFEAWKAADAAHAEAYAQVTEACTQAAGLAREAPLLALRHEALTRAMLARKPRIWARPRLIAGVAVLAATAPLAAWTIREWTPARPQPIVESFHTGIGQKSGVTLPDGSKVLLDTNSRMTIRFEGAERQVALDGQGWFEIPSGAAPLTISAGGRSFRAGAGRFDIRTDTGLVRAYNAGGALALADGAPVSIRDGELLATKGDTVTLRPLARPAGFTGWRQGLLQFDNVTLADATAELNRYRLRPIRMADGHAAALRVSGVFRTTESPAFTDALASGFPVQVRDRGADGIIIASR